MPAAAEETRAGLCINGHPERRELSLEQSKALVAYFVLREPDFLRSTAPRLKPLSQRLVPRDLPGAQCLHAATQAQKLTTKRCLRHGGELESFT